MKYSQKGDCPKIEPTSTNPKAHINVWIVKLIEQICYVLGIAGAMRTTSIKALEVILDTTPIEIQVTYESLLIARRLNMIDNGAQRTNWTGRGGIQKVIRKLALSIQRHREMWRIAGKVVVKMGPNARQAQ